MCDLAHSRVAGRIANLSAVMNQVTNPQPWRAHETELLDRAVDKIVRYGEKVGVHPEEMISLLDSGMSIRDLLLFLASKDSKDS
jgi:hypothetical protein